MESNFDTDVVVMGAGSKPAPSYLPAANLAARFCALAAGGVAGAGLTVTALAERCMSLIPPRTAANP